MSNEAVIPDLIPNEALPRSKWRRGSHPQRSDEREALKALKDKKFEVAHRPGGAGRDRYIDSLRVVALVRVMTFHTFGWLWLPLIFPSMNIMFALAGGLMASSLDRSKNQPWPVLAKRLRRLLPPLWAFGLVVVPIMLLGGWMAEGSVDDGTNFQWHQLLAWIVPYTIPPGSVMGDDWVVPLWYIRTYMYLMLLSPFMLWAFRKWPKRTFVAPLLALAVLSADVFDFGGGAGDAITSICIFASSWMLGFMHHKAKGQDKSALNKIPGLAVVVVALVLMAAGWLYGATHPEDGVVSALPAIDDIPMADALYGLGFAAILLRFYPNFDWMKKVRPLDAFVTAVNSRAMTIYLWGNLAIFCATPLIDITPLSRYYDDSWVGYSLQYVMAWLVIITVVLLVGWVEDVAGKRRPRLLPWRSSKPMKSARHRNSSVRRLAQRVDF